MMCSEILNSDNDPHPTRNKIRRSQLSETPGGNGVHGEGCVQWRFVKRSWLSVILMSILVGGSLSYLVRGKVVRLELDLPLPELPDRR